MNGGHVKCTLLRVRNVKVEWRNVKCTVLRVRIVKVEWRTCKVYSVESKECEG